MPRWIRSIGEGIALRLIVFLVVVLGWLVPPFASAHTWSPDDVADPPIETDAPALSSAVEVYLVACPSTGPPEFRAAVIACPATGMEGTYGPSRRFLCVVLRTSGHSAGVIEDAFGILIASTGSSFNRFRYCGEEWDANLGMYNLRARLMEPGRGRFWSGDTYDGDNEDPASLHKYLFGNGNPINGCDPTGHWDIGTVMCTMAIGAIIGGGCAVISNYALGQPQTIKSIILSAGIGALLGPLAWYIPTVAVATAGLGVLTAAYTTYRVFTNPDSTGGQKTAALALVLAAVFGTRMAVRYYNSSTGGSPMSLDFPLPIRAPPGVRIRSLQSGLRSDKVDQLPGIMQSMVNGAPIDSIAGYKYDGIYYISEGNHRMAAALSLFQETGDRSYVDDLLAKGLWIERPPPSQPVRMTK